MWTKILGLTSALLVAAGCAGPQFREGDSTILENRRGGNIISHISEYVQIDRSNREYRIRGRVSSAAVIFTTIDNVCLERGSIVRVHAASLRGADTLDSVVAALAFVRPDVAAGLQTLSFVGPEAGTQVIGLFLSGDARRQYLRDWGTTEEFTSIPAREWVELESNARLCD